MNKRLPKLKRCINVRKSYSELAYLYNELLYAVARKFPNETRHDTALRYIREAEDRATEGCCCENVCKVKVEKP